MKKNKDGYVELSLEEFEKLSKVKTCEQCINCIYVEHGDMYCDLLEDETKWVYDNFVPTNDYMWCRGKHFKER